MNNANKLTAAQVALLRVILTNGGDVWAGMGRARPGYVNLRAAWRLHEMGVIVIDSDTHPGHRKLIVEVTPRGCEMLRAAGMSSVELYALPTHSYGVKLAPMAPVRDIDFVAPECR